MADQHSPVLGSCSDGAQHEVVMTGEQLYALTNGKSNCNVRAKSRRFEKSKIRIVFSVFFMPPQYFLCHRLSFTCMRRLECPISDPLSTDHLF